jgi:ectoine hydroxylase-related dioxygenase (phytanoyl-CoA dioxygenase family)
MKLRSNKRNIFESNGYIILKNIILKKKISQIQKVIFNRAKIYLNNNKSFKSFNDINFHKHLIKLKIKNPKRFGSFYDSIQKSLEIYSIMTDEKLISEVSSITKLKKENLSINGENIRIDIPNDKLHSLNWHQDRSYYFQNRDGNKGLVLWIPLINITKKIGPLKACAKSHKLGFVSNYQKKTSNRQSSTQRIVSFDEKKFKVLSLKVNCGDAILLNKNTIHASGKNISNLIRFSLQIRVHDLMDPDYLSFRYKIFYNLNDIKLLKKKGVDTSDIEVFSK